MLETGTKAPAFELPDQNGVMHRLEDYKGKKVKQTLVMDLGRSLLAPGMTTHHHIGVWKQDRDQGAITPRYFR